jgi:hypothetical protein
MTRHVRADESAGLCFTLANRVRELFGDLTVRLRRGRRLNSGQRLTS